MLKGDFESLPRALFVGSFWLLNSLLTLECKRTIVLFHMLILVLPEVELQGYGFQRLVEETAEEEEKRWRGRG